MLLEDKIFPLYSSSGHIRYISRTLSQSKAIWSWVEKYRPINFHSPHQRLWGLWCGQISFHTAALAQLLSKTIWYSNILSYHLPIDPTLEDEYTTLISLPRSKVVRIQFHNAKLFLEDVYHWYCTSWIVLFHETNIHKAQWWYYNTLSVLESTRNCTHVFHDQKEYTLWVRGGSLRRNTSTAWRKASSHYPRWKQSGFERRTKSYYSGSFELCKKMGNSIRWSKVK